MRNVIKYEKGSNVQNGGQQGEARAQDSEEIYWGIRRGEAKELQENKNYG